MFAVGERRGDGIWAPLEVQNSLAFLWWTSDMHREADLPEAEKDLSVKHLMCFEEAGRSGLFQSKGVFGMLP